MSNAQQEYGVGERSSSQVVVTLEAEIVNAVVLTYPAVRTGYSQCYPLHPLTTQKISNGPESTIPCG